MDKKPIFILLLVILIIALQTTVLNSANSEKSSERIFTDPEMVDKSKPNRTWRGRIKKVKKALKNIQKKIQNSNSDINKKLPKCITDALKNLYEPKSDELQYAKKEAKGLKVTLSKKARAGTKKILYH